MPASPPIQTPRLLDILMKKSRIHFGNTNCKSVGLSSVGTATKMDEIRGEVIFRAVFAPVEPHAVVTGQMPHATYQHCSARHEEIPKKTLIKMNTTESKPAKSMTLSVAFWLLGLSGLVAAIEVVLGDATGLRAWLLPLAPWSLALALYAWKRSTYRSQTI